MNTIQKIDQYLKEVTSQVIVESGIRNIRELAKTHKEAEIYFHIDL
jgi:hypothetical protein